MLRYKYTAHIVQTRPSTFTSLQLVFTWEFCWSFAKFSKYYMHKIYVLLNQFIIYYHKYIHKCIIKSYKKCQCAEELRTKHSLGTPRSESRQQPTSLQLFCVSLCIVSHFSLNYLLLKVQYNIDCNLVSKRSASESAPKRQN